MKTSFSFLAILLFMIVCLGCFKRFNYTNIQKIPNTNTYLAKGYFTNDPIPMLVNDEKWLSINTPMPENAYLFIAGSVVDSALTSSTDTTRYYGAFVTVRGTVNTDKLGFSKKILNVEDIEVNSNSSSDRGPYVIDHCDLIQSPCTITTTPPPFCHVSTGSPNKFALLFSGGKDLPNAKYRYWNDLEFMYLTLRSQYNFSDANMVVLYMDGEKENINSEMTVDYPATLPGLNTAVWHLRNQMNLQGLPGVSDTVFIFVTNHGGGFDPNQFTENSGTRASNPLAEGDMYDENIAYYKPAGTQHFIKDDFWKSKWDTLLAAHNPLMIALYEPCFSGGFLRDMKGPNRVNITAASQNGYSYSLPPNNVYDAFSYYFTAALRGVHADGSCLEPGLVTDPFGRVSILEAYKYAHLMDPGPTHKHYIDDFNDGIGVEGAPAASFNGAGQGVLSKTMFLK